MGEFLPDAENLEASVNTRVLWQAYRGIIADNTLHAIFGNLFIKTMLGAVCSEAM